MSSEPEVPPTQAQPNYIGWDWAKLPRDAVKAARNGGPATIVALAECVECKRLMWTCNAALEDLCEEDEYLLRVRNWDLRDKYNKRTSRKEFNPFKEGDALTRTFWPKNE